MTVHDCALVSTSVRAVQCAFNLLRVQRVLSSVLQTMDALDTCVTHASRKRRACADRVFEELLLNFI